MSASRTPLDEAGLALEQRGRAALDELSQLFTRLDPRTDASLALAVAIERTGELLRIARALALRHRSVLDATPDPIQILDRSGRILDVNRTACEVYGYSREEFLALTVFDLNPSLERGQLEAAWQRMVIGEIDSVRTINRRKDGSLFPVEVRSSVYRDGNERLLVGLVRDLSEQERQAQELECRAREALKAQQEFQTLVAAIDKGLAIHDQSGTLRSLNPAGRRLLRLPEGIERIGPFLRDEWELLSEHGEPLQWSEYVQPQRWFGDSASRILGLRHRASNDLLWLSVTVVPQLDPVSGALEQTYALFSDVTELKRAAESFAEIQRLASIGSFEINLKTRQSLWSAQIHALLEIPPGPTPAELFEAAKRVTLPEDQPALRSALYRVGKQGETVDIDFRVRRADGGHRWVSLHARPALASRDHGGWVVSGTLQDITERQREQERLKRMAVQDPLTGLLNRTAFLELTGELMSREETVALLYLDLDRFKIVNDLVGSAAGDRILIAAAQRLTATQTGAAAIARWSGDEFIVAQTRAAADLDSMEQMAERLIAVFNQPFVVEGEEFLLTPSIGIAVHPDHGATPQLLVRNAESAMLEAKRRGRNTLHVFHGGLGRQHDERLAIETQLRRALDLGELKLMYQPKLELATQRLVGVEALLRWHNRSLGNVPPDRFVPYAESSGDIVRIGEWVLKRALADLRLWRLSGMDIECVSVNVSYRQLINEGFERLVEEALRENALEPDSLELEFTERVLIDDAPETMHTLAHLRRMGVTLTIDDFGEGYSALGYLRRLPVQGLKLSHTFMRGVPNHATDTHLCQAIIALARNLDLSVTIEGVERHDQLAFVRQHGAQYGQGFLFAAPMETSTLQARYGPR